MASKNGHKRYDIDDALKLVTDEDMRNALVERKSQLQQRLAGFVLNTQMPGWEPEGAEAQMNQQGIDVICAAIAQIEERLSGASELLKAYGPKG